VCSSSETGRISTAALLIDEERLLLVKRPPGGDLGDMWELPGGKVDPGETPEHALARELQEELGISATIGPCIAEVSFMHNRTLFRLRGHRADADLSTIQLREHVAMSRFTVDEALRLRLAPSDRSLLQKARDTLS
jgi:mutator protein MutT